MNKTAVWITSISAVAVIVAFYVWSSHNRYYIMTSSQGVAYEVDRKTGKSWALLGDQKIEQESPDIKERPEQLLPYAEQAKVTGKAGLSYDAFSGKIYNGSGWTLTRVVINVTAKEEDGSVRWSRDFSENVKIRPLKIGSFSVTVTGEHGIKDAPWEKKGEKKGTEKKGTLLNELNNFATGRGIGKKGGAAMPRQPRLDAPGTLQHVIIRGIQTQPFVADAEDRQQLVNRLGKE